ncbi:MAG: glycosyltransferase [Bacteroidales bacterium]|nr:glycosyltransferase [Bacteroidales bacterium]
MTDNKEIKVTVRCITYNQKEYIRQCLDGFVMQQTNFRFEAIVHDDASSDGTADIVREYAEKYPDIIKPIFETENQYSKHDGSLGRILNANTRGKYVALCEGDDYWTNPHKLQKQADFLDANPQCSLTYHACKNVFSTPCKVNYLSGENVKEFYTDVDLIDYPFQTATVMYRKEIIDSELYKKATAIGCTSGDTIFFLTASRFGTIEGINEQMSVYRRHEGGISQHMYDMVNLWKNFRDWQNVALLFGGEIGEKIKEVKLGYFIYYAITDRNYLLALKMLYSSIFKTSMSVAVGLKLSYNYYYHRLVK